MMFEQVKVRGFDMVEDHLEDDRTLPNQWMVVVPYNE